MIKKFISASIFGLIINSSYAQDEYFTFDNFKNVETFKIYHEQIISGFIADIQKFSSVRVLRQAIVSGCKGDSICRVDMSYYSNSKDIPFVSLYIDTDAVPLKILRYKYLENSYKLNIDDTNNYITIIGAQ